MIKFHDQLKLDYAPREPLIEHVPRDPERARNLRIMVISLLLGAMVGGWAVWMMMSVK